MLVVITPIKIKQQQTKHCVVSVVFSRNYAHLLTLSVESTCSTVKTQRTNFSISGTSKIIYFCGFLALPPLFFRQWMEISHLGAPIRDLQSHMAFFYVILFFFLDAFLKKRMATLSFSKWKWSDDCRAWNCYIKVIVIELCVTKSWWKIKFNKHKKFISFFLSFKPVLNNLTCCNGVAFQK